MTIPKALESLHAVFERARKHARAQVQHQGKLSNELLNQHQLAAHALAYLRTDLEACTQLASWAARVGGPHEKALAEAFVGECLRSLASGVCLSSAERVSMAELGMSRGHLQALIGDDLERWADAVAGSVALVELGRVLHDRGLGEPGLGDEALEQTRAEFRKYADREVVPLAQKIHRDDVLIPLEMVASMAGLGVFGLTIPEEYGGLGLGKVAMCVVTEELSRGYIGVGSLGTRAEIAGELLCRRAPRSRKAVGCRQSPRARCFPPPCLPNPITARTWRTSKRAPSASPTAPGVCTGKRPGSRTPRAPT